MNEASEKDYTHLRQNTRLLACLREREKVCVYVCVCGERERERERVRVWTQIPSILTLKFARF